MVTFRHKLSSYLVLMFPFSYEPKRNEALTVLLYQTYVIIRYQHIIVNGLNKDGNSAH